MSLRVIIAAAGFAAAVAASPGAAAARGLELSFDIFTGGLHVLSLDSRSSVDGTHYVMEARLRTEGLADALVKFVSTQRVSGLLTGAGAKPARFESRSSSRFGPREVAMTFAPDGSIRAVMDPPPEEDDRAPVPQDYRRGALDPLSALLVRIVAMDPDEPCTGMTAVFDGERLYNLHFERLGREQLAPNRYSAYAGPAVKCRVDMERLKDFEAGSEPRRKRREPIYLWLAPLDRHGLMLPVRLTTDTDWGPMVVHLSDYRVKARSASLAP